VATTTYTTLTLVKTALGIPEADTGDDTLLNSSIASASRWIDRDTGRRYWKDDSAVPRLVRTSKCAFWDNGEHMLLVNDIASTAGLIVETGSTSGGWQTVTGYETLPDNAISDGVPITRIVHPSQWPTGPHQRVRITAIWGWPSVPEQVEEAARLLVSRRFRRKDSPQGVAGSADWGVVRIARTDPDVWDLLKDVELPGFG
jgi:hypothetical protein